MKKRTFSLFLAILMVLTVFPLSIFAEDTENVTVTIDPISFELTGECDTLVYNYSEVIGKFNGTKVTVYLETYDKLTLNATAVGSDGETPIDLHATLFRDLADVSAGYVEKCLTADFVSGTAYFGGTDGDRNYFLVIWADEGVTGSVNVTGTIEHDAATGTFPAEDVTLPASFDYELGTDDVVIVGDALISYAKQFRTELFFGDEVTVDVVGKDGPLDVNVKVVMISGGATMGVTSLNGGSASDKKGVHDTFVPLTDATYGFRVYGADLNTLGTVSVSLTKRTTGAVRLTDKLYDAETVSELPAEFTFDSTDGIEVIKDYRIYNAKLYSFTTTEDMYVTVSAFGKDTPADTSIYVYARLTGEDYGFGSYATINTDEYSDGKGEASIVYLDAGYEYAFAFCCPSDFEGTVTAGIKSYSIPKLTGEIDDYAIALDELPFSDTKEIFDCQIFYVTEYNDYFKGMIYRIDLLSGDSLRAYCAPTDSTNLFDTKVLTFFIGTSGDTVIKYYDGDAAGERGEDVLITAVEDGTYYIFVGAYDRTTDDYYDASSCDISIKVAPSITNIDSFAITVDELPYSDTKDIADCDAIYMPDRDSDYVGDFYKIDLKSGEALDIYCAPKDLSGEFDTRVIIYFRGVSGELEYLEYFDEDDAGEYGEHITYTADKDGTYYIFLGSSVSGLSDGEDTVCDISIKAAPSTVNIDSFAIALDELPYSDSKDLNDCDVYYVSERDDDFKGVVYKADIEAGDALDIYCTPQDSSSKLDTKVITFFKDSDGDISFFDYYDYDGVGEYGENITFTADGDGTYYFLLCAYEDSVNSYASNGDSTVCDISFKKGISMDEYFASAEVVTTLPYEFEYEFDPADEFYFENKSYCGTFVKVNLDAEKLVDILFADNNHGGNLDARLKIYSIDEDGKYTKIEDIDDDNYREYGEQFLLYTGDGGDYVIFFGARGVDEGDVGYGYIGYSDMEVGVAEEIYEDLTPLALPNYSDYEPDDYSFAKLQNGSVGNYRIERFTLESDTALVIREYGKNIDIECGAYLYYISETGEWLPMNDTGYYNSIGNGANRWYDQLDAGDYAVVYEYVDSEYYDTVHCEIVPYEIGLDNSLNFLDVNEDMSGDGWEWDNENSTLYLYDGFTMKTGRMSSNSGITLPYGDVTLVLCGDVEIDCIDNYGIYCYGNLNITGSNDEVRLTIKNSYQGICCVGSLWVQDVALDISTYDYSMFLGGEASFVNCTVDINAHHSGCGVFVTSAYGDGNPEVYIAGGVWNVKAGYTAIYADGSVTVEDTRLDLSATRLGYYPSLIRTYVGSVNITGVYADKLDAYDEYGNVTNLDISDIEFGFDYTKNLITNDCIFRLVSNGVIKPGDVNGDGKVNSRDVLVARSFIAGKITAESVDYNWNAADINNDGKINAIDIRLLRAMIAG